jgi:hypothetical protein
MDELGLGNRPRARRAGPERVGWFPPARPDLADGADRDGAGHPGRRADADDGVLAGSGGLVPRGLYDGDLQRPGVCSPPGPRGPGHAGARVHRDSERECGDGAAGHGGRRPGRRAFGVRIWYVMGGVACMLMGAGAFFVPAIMHLEDAQKKEVAAQPSPT